MIRQCTESDFETIYEIINDAAKAYRGVIPENSWHEPYMSRNELSREIQDGIIFWGAEQNCQLAGVMGIQEKGDVTLIRHAYVRTKVWNQGIGTNLLLHIEKTTEKPILIGTWANATWAISFYQKNGYQLVSEAEKNLLLKKYWTIPDIQIETSVVLADAKWLNENAQPII
jgi:N-acetylglutamate synthase-like GNAT family acetyltransferase